MSRSITKSGRIISFLLATLMIIGLSFNCSEVNAAAKIEYDKNMVLYLSDFDNTEFITVYNLKKNAKFNDKSVKISNKSVMTLESTGFYTFRTKKKKDLRLMFLVKKAGKTKVTFKIGNKKYKINVTVKKLKNPIKKMTITGVNNNKNIATKISYDRINRYLTGDWSCFADGFDNVKTSSSTLKVTPAKGWKIKNIFYSADNYSHYRVKKGINYLYERTAHENFRKLKSGTTTFKFDGIIEKPGALYVDMVDIYGNWARAYIGFNANSGK